MNNLLISTLKSNKNLTMFYLDSNVNYDTKINTVTKILDKNQAVRFSILCAESVLHIFEEKYPKDARPRNCLEYLKSINDFNNLTEEQKVQIKKHRDANTTAANNYLDNNFYYKVYYNSYCIANTAYYHNDPSYAVYYAAATDKQEQQQLNIKFLKKILHLT